MKPAQARSVIKKLRRILEPLAQGNELNERRRGAFRGRQLFLHSAATRAQANIEAAIAEFEAIAGNGKGAAE